MLFVHNNLISPTRQREISDLAASFRFKERLTPAERFHRICHHYGIRVIYAPQETHGFIYGIGDQPIIVLSSALSETHRDFVAFHELGHFFFHYGTENGSEFEANLFAYHSLKEAYDS